MHTSVLGRRGKVPAHRGFRPTLLSVNAGVFLDVARQHTRGETAAGVPRLATTCMSRVGPPPSTRL